MKIINKKTTTLLILMILSSQIITSCNKDDQKVDVDAQKTGFAQTAEIQATMTAAALPTATETPEPSPTFTHTPELTPTTDVTATATVSATTPVVTGVDAAQWIGQVPEDNAVFKPGEKFTVTWTLENTGTSTWTMDYCIEFSSQDQMGAEKKYFLPYPVTPGTNVQISAEFTAPDSEGTKQSNWSLVNSGGIAFYDFWVIIKVSESGGEEVETPTVTPETTY